MLSNLYLNLIIQMPEILTRNLQNLIYLLSASIYVSIVEVHSSILFPMYSIVRFIYKNVRHDYEVQMNYKNIKKNTPVHQTLLG